MERGNSGREDVSEKRKGRFECDKRKKRKGTGGKWIDGTMGRTKVG